MVQSFIDYIQYQKRYSAHTVCAYKCDLDQFATFLMETSGLQPADAKLLEVKNWLYALSAAKTKATSIKRKMASLRSYYKYLLQQGTIVSHPMALLKMPRAPKRNPVFVPEKDILNLLDTLHQSGDAVVAQNNQAAKNNSPFGLARQKLVLELLYGTGIRLQELISITHQDINLENRTLLVLGKRNKQRLVPLHNSLPALISDYLTLKIAEGHSCHYQETFLVLDSGKPMYPVYVQRLVQQQLGTATTIQKKSPHVLRHTFATHMLNHGAELTAIKDILGHASLAATAVYTHNTYTKLHATYNNAHPKSKLKQSQQQDGAPINAIAPKDETT